MSNILPTDRTTRALRRIALAQLRAEGYEVQRAPSSQFARVQQVYFVSRGGQSRIVALRTSTTGWLGFRRDGNTFPVLVGIDSVIHIYLHADRRHFALSLIPATSVRSCLDVRMAMDRAPTLHCDEDGVETVTPGREPGPIVWINATSLVDICDQDYFLMRGVHPIPEEDVGSSNEDEDEDVDPIQAALGLPDWMWQAVQDRATRAVVSPEVIIRVLLGDHLAAETQAPLPVALGV